MATKNPFTGKETKSNERKEMAFSAKRYAAGERAEGEKGKAFKKPAQKGRKC